ncbi:MAG: hypothetical protein SFZ23_14940 [Planctomycetota bacterium]|nr:hypothetical protein [Planctomycetota bacterium]
MKLIPSLLAAGCLVATASMSLGQVTLYSMGKVGFWTQAADNVLPPAAYTWGAYGAVYVTALTDATTASAQFSGGGNPFLFQPVGSGFPYFTGFGGYFDTQGLLDAAFPQGSYTFTVSGGTLGTQSDSLTFSNALYPPAQPRLTGNTFSHMAELDPRVDFVGTINSFVPSPLATESVTSIGIYRRSGQGPSFYAQLSPSTTTFTIPADTLRTGRPYIFVLSFTSTRVTRGFGNAQAAVGAGYTTQFVFDVGCPADFNQDFQVDFFDYLDFVVAFDAQDPEADFNGDAQFDFFDYLDFVFAYDRPCDL